jgi:tissue factor pathway inhibitor
VIFHKSLGHAEVVLKKYFYNRATGQCERFTYGGCKGNENNVDTQAECETRCGSRGKEG